MYNNIKYEEKIFFRNEILLLLSKLLLYVIQLSTKAFQVLNKIEMSTVTI